MKKITLLSTSFFVFVWFAASLGNACEGCESRPDWSLHSTFEYGFADVLTHVIQFGQIGGNFDLVREGGQSTLFPSWRASVALRFLQDHTLELLYQPIYLETQSVLGRDVVFDNVTLTSGTPVNSRYYFPYYRLTYFYNFIDNEAFTLAGSLGIQIRNATIGFESSDGSRRFVTTNIGPVPLLGARLRYNLNKRIWLGSELAGLWAPIPGINGSKEPVTGWIYDGSLQFGLNINSRISWFLSSRIIGGGAKGDGAARASGDRYSFNDLNILNFSTGVIVHHPTN